MIPLAVRRRANLAQSAEEMRRFYRQMGVSPEITERAIAANAKSPLPSPSVMQPRRDRERRRSHDASTSD
jgi:hypothetical protein